MIAVDDEIDRGIEISQCGAHLRRAQDPGLDPDMPQRGVNVVLDGPDDAGCAGADDDDSALVGGHEGSPWTDTQACHHEVQIGLTSDYPCAAKPARA